MSSTTMSSERTIRSTTLPVEASIRERAIVAVSASRLNQLTRRSRSIAAWAIASAKWLLPVPDGPTRTRFSARPIQSSVRSAHCASPAIAEAFGSQASNVLPDGKAGRLAMDVPGGPVAPRCLFGQEDLEQLDVIPARLAGPGEDRRAGLADVA